MKIYTEMDIKRIYLVMGIRCNFNCKYCYERNMAYSDFKLSNDTLEYLKRIAEMKPFIKDNPIRILFWGGEPLLYFDVIKECVEKLSGYGFEFSTVSNGILFTDEIVDYFNYNHIGVAISHDGINTVKTRNIDVLNSEKVNILKRINDLSIDSVISAYNYDYLGTIDYVYNKLEREIPIAFEWLHCDSNTPKDLYNFDYDLYKYNVYNYLGVVSDKLASGVLDSISAPMAREFLNIANPTKELSPRCGQMKTSLNIDLQGNIMACHPSTIIGNTKSDYQDMVDKYNREINQAFSFADCGFCEYVKECKAGCPLEIPCDGKLAVCKAKKIYFKAVKDFLNKEYTIGSDNIG